MRPGTTSDSRTGPGTSRRLVLAAVVLLGSGAAPGWAEPSRPVQGRLDRDRNLLVLRLWGSPYEQGYAHGYLLAPEIMELLNGVLFDPRVMPEPHTYANQVRQGIMPRMTFAPTYQQELDGLYAGLRDRLGPQGLHLDRFNRPLDITDLKAVNTLADWNPSGCTSFAAWGAATTNGQTLIARNLDYLDLPGINRLHLLLVRTDAPAGRKRFASVTWPGSVAAYTAVNEDGVFVAMHDVIVPKNFDAPRWVPRGLVIREIVETADPTRALDEQLRGILGASPAFRGNNLMVAGPNHGSGPPAVVCEYDGRTTLTNGFHLRLPGDQANGTAVDTLACTNHYRTRGVPLRCSRYASIASLLGAVVEGETTRLDAAGAFEVIKAAAGRRTIHSVVWDPAAHRLRVHLATPEQPNATLNPPHLFDLPQLLAR